MNFKALKEKRNSLVAEMEALVHTAETEVRALAIEEQEKFATLKNEISDIDNTIAMAEEKRNSSTVEVVENKIEERGKNMEFTQEMEIRGIEQFLRKENGEEVRAMNMTSGGALVPTHLYGEIVKKIHEVAPLFARTRLFTPVNGQLDILAEDNIGQATFVGDMENLSANDFTTKKVSLKQKRCGSAIELSQHLVNDSGIDVVSYSVELLAKRIAMALDRVIVNGKTSANQPEGLLYAPEACDVEAAAASAIGFDDVLEVYNTLAPEFIGGAVWIIGRKEFNKLVKLKDATGNYYVVKDLANIATPYKLLGLPVFVTDAMPANTGVGGERVLILANLDAAYATMIKKAVELKSVVGDTTQALRGSQLLVMDMFCDGAIINPQAIRILKTPQV